MIVQTRNRILDTECLKIDLHEEQIREKSLAEQKRQQRPILIEVLAEETTLEKVSDVEKHEFADRYVKKTRQDCQVHSQSIKMTNIFSRHRIKGNEFFKSSDYHQAISEYSRSLSYAQMAAVYNNRAVAREWIFS